MHSFLQNAVREKQDTLFMLIRHAFGFLEIPSSLAEVSFHFSTSLTERADKTCEIHARLRQNFSYKTRKIPIFSAHVI